MHIALNTCANDLCNFDISVCVSNPEFYDFWSLQRTFWSSSEKRFFDNCPPSSWKILFEEKFCRGGCSFISGCVNVTMQAASAFVVNLKPMRSFEKYPLLPTSKRSWAPVKCKRHHFSASNTRKFHGRAWFITIPLDFLSVLVAAETSPSQSAKTAKLKRSWGPYTRAEIAKVIGTHFQLTML